MSIDFNAANHGAELISVIYLSITVVVVTTAMLLVVRATGWRRRALSVLAVAVVLMAITRNLFGYLITAGQFTPAVVICGVGWVAGLFTVGLAALVNGEGRVETAVPLVPSRASLGLPYVPLVAAGVVATWKLGAIPELIPVLAASIVMVGAVLARQFFALTDNRRLLQSAAEQALRDPLTGIANRVLFHDRLAHAAQLRQRDSSPITVLVLDLDNFKLVNDSMGHPVGDELLGSAAQRLLQCTRAGDTVARLGGDEFAVLMQGGEDSARLIAYRLVQAFGDPFLLAGQAVLIHASFGLAVASAHDRDVSADVLFRQADAAMYAAKRMGTGGLQTFSSDVHTIDSDPAVSEDRAGAGPSAVAAVRLLGELRHAIDNGDLGLAYQPKIDLQNMGIVGVEALVRWPHPQLGKLAPDRFLPLVRQHGLMRVVTDMVVAKALDDAADWQSRSFPTAVAVNVFAPSMMDPDLPVRLGRALAERGLPAELLTVEITEDLLLNDLRRARTVLGELREQGIRVSLDDFGSGYSALSYLRELEVDEMKICRPLVEPIVTDSRAEAVVRAVIDLAHVLGATVVAEGVENQATEERLREFGCDIVQGYHYYRPLTADATAELLAAQQRRFDTTVTG